ncbi:unnamed protein product [Agarophyton chilense]|eukprot:gb/GEZJ01002537.1/.p1 GENE.gb/GEZJ01002537.1/~~gb/GEZJ01002537.1/.p1  ORF type:complete len:685 (+),score=107.84 gb/GEZJ01002537.1/:242-2296(+)
MRRQHQCDACARVGKVQVSQYRCPACLRCSCSLACVKDHKQHYNCSGVRDKTAPVPKRNYDEHNLISDYALLEEAKRNKDQASRNRVKHFYNPRAPNSKLPDPIPKHKQRVLGRQASMRGIDLRFMPNVFYRHRVNTTFVRPVDYANSRENDGVTTYDGFPRPFDKIMVWRVDVQFSGTDGGTRLVSIHDLDEEVNMNDVLERAIKSLDIRKEPRMNGAVDPYLHYSGLPVTQLNAYIKNEVSLGARRAQPSSLPDFPKYKRRKMVHGRVDLGELELDTRGFIPVDTSNTLRESLYSALVVEYPILYIAPKGSEEDKQLEQATKSLFNRPEPEADDSVRPPTRPMEPEERHEDNVVNPVVVEMSEAHAVANRTDADPAPAPAPAPASAPAPAPASASATCEGTQPEATSVPNSFDKEQFDDKIEQSSPVVAPIEEKVAQYPQPRGVKRKATAAETSDDDESDLSELERNITKRFTPHKKNGAKTGWTRDGKVRTAGEKRPTSSPVPIPRFRSVLPPIHYDKGEGTQASKQKEMTRRNESLPATSEAEESENNEIGGDNELDGGLSENESATQYVGDDESEQRVGDEVVGQKRSMKKPTQERRRPTKRQRFGDLETIEAKEDEKRGECEADQSDDEDGEKPKPRRQSGVESPPLPFLKVDSVMLDTRIPRRKKMTDSNGMETLAC